MTQQIVKAIVRAEVMQTLDSLVERGTATWVGHRLTAAPPYTGSWRLCCPALLVD